MIDLSDIEAAQQRIEGKVRRTPIMQAGPMREPAVADAELWLKLECQQISGSFKARGATNMVTCLDEAKFAKGLVTASGGNHGSGVAYAGWRAGAPVRVFLPEGTPQAKYDLLAAWDAEVVTHGKVWDDANAAALAAAEADGLTYVHPFADDLVVAGQGTLGLEIFGQLPHLDVLVVAIGGGGLIAGVAVAVKALSPETRIIGVEPTGAPTLQACVKAGGLVSIDKISTQVGVLAALTTDQTVLDIVTDCVEDIVLVSDDDMLAASRWLWREFGVAAELGGAAATAALLNGKISNIVGKHVCSLICGSGRDGIE
ncbi:MAG: pyridoxal-phosphate dependent enzyme [Alphaproteobacteria bacterium]|jgi:threonine dehydratase|nr:pyridoxal-phosphate dependent enzyme [Alphaproteobacteria bacterium]MDP6238743.1 pyridoxal-phosphate dependent enzyme [Alphaproteobacteria bacterium]MDP7173271.1 pyridoxal-phosphate dependent enzyme [Alphaproteobacteria bacterium]MDP7487030.1 pyridoxal-phosphate dependent enzyme [Alphaproteobacteria bacterium]MEE1543961.1 pyridoxal-phosphate dependent enzyme [Alphaproteobacteria bacterium]|tara:strand:- start:1449 stop:2390 length:942 start_codon:yes stop_codon:yes gene_type:complete